MPDTTTLLDLPYPLPDEGADGPAAFQALAEAIEAAVPGKGQLPFNVFDYGAVGDGATDDAAEIQAAINAAAGAGIVELGPKTYLIATPLALPAGATGLTIRGAGPRTVIKLDPSMAGKGAFSLGVADEAHKDAAGAIWKNIVLERLVVDCNHTEGHGHVIVGTYSQASYSSVEQLRVNVDGFTIRQVKAINVPTASPADDFLRVGVAFIPQTSGDECYLKNIVCEDVKILGGNGGLHVAPILNATAGQTTATGAPYTVDNVVFERCYHDTLVNPTAFISGSANFFIGGRAKGGRARISDCYGRGSADVGIETDAMRHMLVDDCEIEDAYNANYYHTNYNVPLGSGAQRLTYRSCVARRVGWTPASEAANTVSRGWNFDRHATFGVSRVRIIDGAYERTTADWQVDGEAITANGGMVLELDGFDVYRTGINVTLAAPQTNTDIDLNPVSGGAAMAFRARSLRFTNIGAQAGGQALTYYPIRYQGDAVGASFKEVNVDGVTFDFRVTGVVGGSHGGIFVQVGTFQTCRHANLRVTNIGGDTAALFRMIHFYGSNLAVPYTTPIDGIDTGALLSASSKGVEADNSTVQKRIRITRAVVGNGSPYAPAAIVVTGTPFTYTNLDMVNERIILKGGTVTKVEISAWQQDGSAYTEIGATGGMWVIEPGDRIRVTCSDPADLPTMTKIALLR